MGASSVKEVINRSGEFLPASTSATRVWEIVASSANDDSQTLGSALIGGDLPDYLTQHPNNNYLTCRQIRFTNVQGLVWRAVATYSAESVPLELRERAQVPNPINRAVRISWGTAEYTKIAVNKLNSENEVVAITNSAGDPPDPPQEITWERLVFRFRKNYETPPIWILNFCNSVNSTAINILGISVDAGKAKFSSPSSSELQEENGQLFYETEWEIHCDVQTWQLVLLDEGLREVSGNNDEERVRITDDNSEPAQSPMLLDGAGKKLADPTLDNAVFITHNVYYQRDYSGLPGVSAG